MKQLDYPSDWWYEVGLVKPKLSKENQFLLELLIWNMLNWDCWIFIIINSEKLFTLTSMKYLRWTLSLSTKLWSSVRRKTGRRFSQRKTRRVECNALQSLHRHFYCQKTDNFFPQNLLQNAAHKKHNKSEISLFKKSLDAQKCWVSVQIVLLLLSREK